MKNSTPLKLYIEKYHGKYSFLTTSMIAAIFFVALSLPSFAQSILSPVTTMQQLKTNLYEVATLNLLDATLTQYSIDGNNGIDRNDAVKIPSIGAATHLGMFRHGRNLIIERRQSIIVNDTIFYNLMTASKRNYSFQFIPDNLDGNVVTIFLEDAYLNTAAPVTVTDTTTVNFTVNADAASSAADRFRLIFGTTFVVLPLPFTFNVRANQQHNDIAVEWIAENEVNIKSYNVETSANGLQFVKAATVIAKQHTTAENYQWLDANADPGPHYYRIRSINNLDEILYSEIVKVTVNPVKAGIVVYPNPVVNARINVRFTNQPKGNYVLKLIDNSGRVAVTKQVHVSELTVTETLNAGQNMDNGAYHLKIVSVDKNLKSFNLILQ